MIVNPYGFAAVASFAWWRVFVIDVNGGAGVQINEVELRTSLGGADATALLTGSSTEAVASAADSGAEPWRGFDSDASAASHWATFSATTNQWLAYRFATDPGPILQLGLRCNGTSTAPTRMPKNFKLQKSTDSTNGSDGSWTDIGTFFKNDWVRSGTFITFNV